MPGCFSYKIFNIDITLPLALQELALQELVPQVPVQELVPQVLVLVPELLL